MSQPFIGQVLLSGFGFAPKNYALCNGQTLQISQNQALFSLLGTTYGGNGVQTFLLPNLQSCVPVGFGSSSDGAWQPQTYNIGDRGGAENVTLNVNQIPTHTHPFNASTQAGTATAPAGVFSASSTNSYGAAQNLVSLGGAPLPPTGNSPHTNIQPLTVISFSIALYGIFPSRN